MLFNISGSQGQGKSTVLRTLDDVGYKTIPNKTARSILQDWGLSLSDVYSSSPLTIMFQEEILKRHSEACQPYVSTSMVCFIERSYSDIFSYALAIIGPHNKYDEWLNGYYERCKYLQKLQFAASFYLTGRQADVENDGVRSTNTHFSQLMDYSIRHYIEEFGNKNGGYSYVIDSTDNDERVSRIASTVEALK